MPLLTAAILVRQIERLASEHDLIRLEQLTAVGLLVAFVLFDGPGDLFARAAADPGLARLLAIEGGTGSFDWIAMTLLAMAAIVCLARQFQIMITENADERHLDRARSGCSRSTFSPSACSCCRSRLPDA